MKTLHNNYYNSKQGYLPLFLSDCLDLMAIAKEEAPADDLTDKLKTYQELKEQYLTQKQELKDEGLEQKSLTDPDSRRMKNNGSLDICYNVQSIVDAKNHFVVEYKRISSHQGSSRIQGNL